MSRPEEGNCSWFFAWAPDRATRRQVVCTASAAILLYWPPTKDLPRFEGQRGSCDDEPEPRKSTARFNIAPVLELLTRLMTSVIDPRGLSNRPAGDPGKNNQLNSTLHPERPRLRLQGIGSSTRFAVQRAVHHRVARARRRAHDHPPAAAPSHAGKGEGRACSQTSKVYFPRMLTTYECYHAGLISDPVGPRPSVRSVFRFFLSLPLSQSFTSLQVI